MKQTTRKKRIIGHLGNVALAMISFAFMVSPVQAAEVQEAGKLAKAAEDVLALEGGKKALNEAIKVAKTKPALSIAAGIVCLACAPAAGAVASPAMCVACGILITKVLG